MENIEILEEASVDESKLEIKAGPMSGKHHTEETKTKIGAASKGRKQDPEIVKARSKKLEMSEERQKQICDMYNSGESVNSICKSVGTNTHGVYRVLERNGISKKGAGKTFSGKSHSEETKSKMSEAQKSVWSDRKTN